MELPRSPVPADRSVAPRPARRTLITAAVSAWAAGAALGASVIAVAYTALVVLSMFSGTTRALRDRARVAVAVTAVLHGAGLAALLVCALALWVLAARRATGRSGALVWAAFTIEGVGWTAVTWCYVTRGPFVPHWMSVVATRSLVAIWVVGVAGGILAVATRATGQARPGTGSLGPRPAGSSPS